MSVVVQELDATGRHVGHYPPRLIESTNPTEVINLLPGANGASIGNFFTQQIGGASSALHNIEDRYPVGGGVQTLRYWIYGPGVEQANPFPTSEVPSNLPPQIQLADFGADPWGISFFLYLVMPTIEIVCGIFGALSTLFGIAAEDAGLEIPIGFEAATTVADVLGLTATHSLQSDALRASIRSKDKTNIKAAGIDLLSSYLIAGLGLTATAVGGTYGAVLSTFSLIPAGIGILCGGINYVRAIDYWLQAPVLTYVDVPVEGETEPFVFTKVAETRESGSFSALAVNALGDAAYAQLLASGQERLVLHVKQTDGNQVVEERSVTHGINFTSQCLNNHRDVVYNVVVGRDFPRGETVLKRFGEAARVLAPPAGFFGQTGNASASIITPKSLLNRRGNGTSFVFGTVDKFVGQTLVSKQLWVHDGTVSAAVDFGKINPFIGDEVFLHDMRVAEDGMVVGLISVNDPAGPRSIVRYQYPIEGATPAFEEVVIIRENVSASALSINFTDTVAWLDNTANRIRFKKRQGITEDSLTPPVGAQLSGGLEQSVRDQFLSIGTSGADTAPVFFDVTGPPISLLGSLPGRGSGERDTLATQLIAMRGRFVAVAYGCNYKQENAEVPIASFFNKDGGAFGQGNAPKGSNASFVAVSDF